MEEEEQGKMRSDTGECLARFDNRQEEEQERQNLTEAELIFIADDIDLLGHWVELFDASKIGRVNPETQGDPECAAAENLLQTSMPAAKNSADANDHSNDRHENCEYLCDCCCRRVGRAKIRAKAKLHAATDRV